MYASTLFSLSQGSGGRTGLVGKALACRPALSTVQGRHPVTISPGCSHTESELAPSSGPDYINSDSQLQPVKELGSKMENSPLALFFSF